VLEGSARWNALRFAAHRGAVDATLGDVNAALASFTALEEAPELRKDPMLGELTTLLRAAVDIALAEVDSPGGEPGRQARESARRYVEAFHNLPRRVLSLDVRGVLRFLERMLSRPAACRGG
jgi:hypothetical protein